MKYLKTYEAHDNYQDLMMRLHYGHDVIRWSEDIIQDINDIVVDLKDDGYSVLVGYTPLTYSCKWKYPEFMVNISKDGVKLQEGEERSEFDSVLLRLTSYITSIKWKYEAGFYDAHTKLGIRIFKEER